MDLNPAQITANNVLTPSDSTNITALATKGIMIFGAAAGVTVTLNIQGINDSAAVSLAFISNGSPYIYYPGQYKLLKSTGTTLNGATVYGLS